VRQWMILNAEEEAEDEEEVEEGGGRRRWRKEANAVNKGLWPCNACHRAAPETTPLWRLFLINLSLSLSLSLSL